MNETDGQLLARYAQTRAEGAFTTIVQRHLGLVYSSALRQIRLPQLAEEIAQNVFIKLARHAGHLASDTILTAWLYQVTHREAIDVGRRETRRQLREQISTEMNAVNATDADWTHIEPLLDEAMHALDDTDRTAVLLRYFENKSLREVGDTLGTSENAAQKRLTRAMERLREFFAKRGVTVGTSGLAVLISANAILTTPAGLSAAIVAAAMSVGGMVALGLGAQIAGLAGRFGLPGLTVSALVLGIVTLVAWREARSPDDSQNAVAAGAISSSLGTSTTAPVKLATHMANRSLNPVAAVPVDTTQRDLALKLYHEGQTLQRERQQFKEAMIKYDMADAIIQSGLPSERWMVDFYFTRATMRSELFPSSKRDYVAEIEDYTKALRINPNYSGALGNRGLAYAALKQYEAANADYTRLIEDPAVDYSNYDPGRTNGIARAYENRGRMWHFAHRELEAISDLKNAVAFYDKFQDQVDAQFYLAAAYKASQQHEQLVAEANSLSEQALKWATRAGGNDQERNAAISAARWGNEFTDYKASFQLEVAAAVKAKLGDFTEAQKYQEDALRELPASAESQREAMQARLETYRARKTLVSP